LFACGGPFLREAASYFAEKQIFWPWLENFSFSVYEMMAAPEVLLGELLSDSNVYCDSMGECLVKIS
jgi:hypothetical protein